MMGTEGRRPGQDIPPSNDVYDLVVFRSSDIEDLQIFEPPIITPSKPFTDPAIVSSSVLTFELQTVLNSSLMNSLYILILPPFTLIQW